MMDLASTYDISRTSEFIRGGNFSRVALQFPDELLKDSPWVAKALREEVGRSGARFYVMADTAYGSCCVDEVAASHVDADCVVHYGHACMAPTTLPALYVFGKECIDINACLEAMHQCLSATKKPILILFGLEYAHAISTIKSLVTEDSSRLGDLCQRLHFAHITCDSMMPSGIYQTDKEVNSVDGVCPSYELHKNADDRCNLQGNTLLSNYSLGGLTWRLPEDMKIEDCKLFWIGLDNSAYANVVLTFNSCDIVRFDARENCLVEDTSHLKRILKRRYYLVEKAKDANIVGILIGTLGLADHLNTIQHMKELIEGAGKKTYTLVMGRPSPAKLANFPECDVFVYVSCAQTTLLDSKEFLAPVITPFEAMLAFSGGFKWTGEYIMDFRDMRATFVRGDKSNIEEARFSFLKGGYVEDTEHQENRDQSIILVEATEKALSLDSSSKDAILFKGEAKSGGEYLAARCFRGLEINHESAAPQSVIIGRSGRASGYENEKNQ